MINLKAIHTGKILNLFFQNPEKEYYLREMSRYLDCEPGFFQHAINGLIKEGILIDERKGNLRLFKLNKKYPLYEEVKKIISKTLGIEAQLKKLVHKLKGIEYAFIFGSIAKGKEYAESDIDLMLIGQIDQDDLINKINALEENLKREVNYHVYGKKEVIQKLASKNEFLTRIFREPKIVLKGNIYESTETA